MKKKIIIAIIVLVAGYFIWKQFFAKPKGDTDTNNQPAPGTTPSATPTPKEITDKTMLDKSMVKTYISQVSWIQYYYNKYVVPKTGKQPITQDGYFGNDTEAAVKFVTGKTKTSWVEFGAAVRKNYITEQEKKSPEFDITTGTFKK